MLMFATSISFVFENTKLLSRNTDDLLAVKSLNVNDSVPSLLVNVKIPSVLSILENGAFSFAKDIGSIVVLSLTYNCPSVCKNSCGSSVISIELSNPLE